MNLIAKIRGFIGKQHNNLPKKLQDYLNPDSGRLIGRVYSRIDDFLGKYSTY